MDFFEHQDQARRNTLKLIGLFVLAVIVIVISINAAVLGALHVCAYYQSGEYSVLIPVEYEDNAWTAGSERSGEGVVQGLLRAPWLTAMYVSIGTLVVIVGGTIYKVAILSRGGSAVARMLGGRVVLPNTNDPDEQKLRNVVEEMAIAAGVPVPELYLLEKERGINAFAAGFTTRDAVIGVTRGCIELLDRDELQGVIAHEFSHILHGDMRLNIRLIGVLHGIFVISLIGYIILRSTSERGGRSSRRGGGAALVFIVLVGAALMGIGYIGVFFGRLIQSAVSRQREFLADASAVQFTRNPGGVVGALKKIGGYSAGARVDHASAMEASHMFFGSAITSGIGGLLTTHPPLVERIRRIEPGFDGQFAKVEARTPASGRANVGGLTSGVAEVQGVGRAILPVPGRFSQLAGNFSTGHVGFAVDLLRSIPGRIVDAAREPLGACAVVYCLLLHAQRELRLVQLEHLRGHADPRVYQETLKLVDPVTALGAGARLPLLDLAVPALRQLSREQLGEFERNIKKLVEADRQVSLFEYTFWKILQHQLSAPKRAGRAPQFYAMKPLLGEAGVLLSAIAWAGKKDPALADACFQVGMSGLDSKQVQRLSPTVELRAIEAALDRLANAAPAIKRRVLDAAGQCAVAEGRICAEEAELIRAIAAVLDCPMPPFLERVGVRAEGGSVARVESGRG